MGGGKDASRVATRPLKTPQTCKKRFLPMCPHPSLLHAQPKRKRRTNVPHRPWQPRPPPGSLPPPPHKFVLYPISTENIQKKVGRGKIFPRGSYTCMLQDIGGKSPLNRQSLDGLWRTLCQKRVAGKCCGKVYRSIFDIQKLIWREKFINSWNSVKIGDFDGIELEIGRGLWVYC